MAKDKKEIAKKIASILLNVVIYFFFALCLLFLILSMASKRDVDGAVKIFGHEIRIVLTGSMEKNEHTWDEVKHYKVKNVPQYSAIFVELVPEDEEKAEEWYSELKVGDVITFRYVMTVTQETITHRIVSIEEKETGGRILSIRADNGAGLPESWPPQIIDTTDSNSVNYVVGKVTGKSLVLGWITYQVKQPLGLALIIIIPCSILIIVQIIKIVNALNAKKHEAAEQAQQDELEALKRKLAALEGGTADVTAENVPTESEQDSAENAEK